MICFKGTQYPKDVILSAVFFYVRYAVSYRDLEEIMAARGVNVDHTTLTRWTIRQAPLIAEEAKKKKPSVSGSWPMDDTYIKGKGRWVYLYRAVDTLSNTIDFMLSEKRDEAAATAFFKQAIDKNGMPEKVVIDKSGSNNAGIETAHMIRKGQLTNNLKPAHEQFMALAG